MKKLFIAAMALATIVSCSKDGIDAPATPSTGSEVAKLAVSLQTVKTRADYNYTNGDDLEHEVNSIDFYLFADGDAYNGADGHNRVSVDMETLEDWTLKADDGNNITKTSDIILVIAKEKNVVPTHIVAVINATADYKGLDLAELQSAVAEDLQTDLGFVMSNSVYDSETETGVVVATEIKPENIFVDTESTDEAGEAGEAYTGKIGVAPVQIYVERVAAKVKVSSKVADDNGFIPVKDENGDAMEDTFIKVLGWEITNATSASYLLKSYDAEKPYFSDLNVPAAFRSHWATTKPQTVGHTLTFSHIADLKNDGKNALVLDAYNYYHENTLTATNAEGWFNEVVEVTGAEGYAGTATQSPQLIVAAQLVDANGKAKEFGTWYGKTYENVNGLKAAMINNAAKQIFVIESTDDPKTEEKEPTVLRSISVGDVVFYQVDDQTSYQATDWNGDFRHEVRVMADKDKKYYDAKGESMEAEDVTAILEKTEPAMIWTSGYTYYYTLIKHYAVGQTQLHGMVRNHVYDVNITGVNGFGTPVYEPYNHIITPEPPKEQDGFSLTAEINVLAWAVVENDVELGN